MLFLERHFPEAFLQVKGGTEPESVTCAIKYRTYFNFSKTTLTMALDVLGQTFVERVQNTK